jgi:hypothetical protein
MNEENIFKIDKNTRKYFDVNSQYRNRNLYPNPNDFVIPSSASTSNILLDPILSSLSFTASSSPVGDNFTLISPVSSDPDHYLDPPFSDYLQNQVVALSGNEPDIENFYNGNTLQLFGNQFHRIIKYDPIRKYAVVDTPYNPPNTSNIPINSQYFIIKSPSYFTSAVNINDYISSSGSVNKINLLNRSPSFIDDFYKGEYIIFSGSNKTALVTSYKANPNTIVYSQNNTESFSSILSTTREQGFRFISTKTAALNYMEIVLNSADYNTSHRTIQFKIYKGSGLNNNLMYQSVYNISNTNSIPFRFIPTSTLVLKNNIFYTVSLKDISSGGINTGYVYLFGIKSGGNFVTYNSFIYPHLEVVATSSGVSTWSQPNSYGYSEYISTQNKQQYSFIPNKTDYLAYLDLTLMSFDSVNNRLLEIEIYIYGVNGTLVTSGNAYVENILDKPTSVRFMISDVLAYSASIIPEENFTFSNKNSWILYNYSNLLPINSLLISQYPPTVNYDSSFILPNDLESVLEVNIYITGDVNFSSIPSNKILFKIYDHDTKEDLNYTVDPSGLNSDFNNTLKFTINDNSKLFKNQNLDLVLFITEDGYILKPYNNIFYQFTFSYISTNSGIKLGEGANYTLTLKDLSTTPGYINLFGIKTPLNPYFTFNTEVYPQMDLIGSSKLWSQDTSESRLEISNQYDSQKNGYYFTPEISGPLTSMNITLTTFKSVGEKQMNIYIIDSLGSLIYSSIFNIPNISKKTKFNFIIDQPPNLIEDEEYILFITDSENNNGQIYLYGQDTDLTYKSYNDLQSVYPQIELFVSVPETVYIQPNMISDREILNSGTEYGYIFIPNISGYVNKIGISLISFDLSGKRNVEIQIYNGNELTDMPMLPVSPPITVDIFNTSFNTMFNINFDLTDLNIPLLNQNSVYTFSIKDVTSTGNSTGSITVFGVPIDQEYQGINGSVYPTINFYMPTFVLTFTPAIPYDSFIGGNMDMIEFNSKAVENATSLLTNTNLSLTKQTYYKIRLINLIMPNQVLDTDYGGALDSYPYVYVAFYNEGFKGNINTLMSNNSNSALALFKVFIDKEVYETKKYFFTFEAEQSGDNGQIIYFRPDRDVRFRVFLPSGETVSFKTKDNDLYRELNPLIQVSCTFEIISSE